MRAITPAQTRAFWRYMSRRYGTRVVPKASAAEMRAIAAFLDAVGIMDAADFLRRYTTTLPALDGRPRIYPCFTIGDPAAVALPDQVGTAVHEHVHARQLTADPQAGIRYCADPAARATMECEAYRATMELAFWFTGRCPAVGGIVATLKAYALRAADLRFAKQYLTAAAAVVRRGGVVTPEAKAAIAWLEAYT